ncbi:TRAP transporter small permease subunit [Deinococcus cellulosilyticus]|uniref:C4-dicarboxylate ABC transporter substrate-binding protein n=1 Tax=Deinococcus cellulosilyticus (strain DSM 18568 / NBRC 106333 / KACC 11606 / 5516J-15) TaxID=1223518 RepID=A0A511N7R8_DEIC1|nr:TRAP transporter small permease subunit [Deinococcus cellulosilyticus]GEM48883.1 C4-dicarboxylate ABC transporter substrate-binding protein [Deinococcus cellulosilyticus NBRC 106333 = KACC 11606]
MAVLLRISVVIDFINEWMGRIFLWLILLAVIVGAGNAVIRKIIFLIPAAWASVEGSFFYWVQKFYITYANRWLEAQSYMFSIVFLLMGGYTLLYNRHVRVDLLYTRYSPRTKAILNLVGSLLFLLPTAFCIVYFSWPQLVESYHIREMSSDAGGLPRWPIKLMIPVGFALLVLQALSEAIKNAAFLAGKYKFKNDHEEAEGEVV